MNNAVVASLFENQYFIIFLILWEMVWKGLALWKAVKCNQKAFFIALLVINTFGLFPIGYLIYRYIVEKKPFSKLKKK
jgi:hypothetical protein